MKQKFIQLVLIAIITILMTSCASGKIVLSNDANISKYKYVIFGKETSGDRELDDIVMSVQNQIAETNLTVLSASNTLKIFECLIVFSRQIFMLHLKNGMEGIHI